MCVHRSIIFWDHTSQQFKKETRKRHMWPWYFSNFVIMGAFQIPLLITYFLQCLQDPERATLVGGMMACFQFCFATACLEVAYDSFHSISDVISFLNEIVVFEQTLETKYSTNLANQRGLDILGFFSNIEVLGSLMVPTCSLWIFLNFKVDPLMLVFCQVTPDFSLPARIAFHTARAILVTGFLMEAPKWTRTMILVGLLVFRGLHSCHGLLLSQPVSEMVLGELRQFCIIFARLGRFLGRGFLMTLSLCYTTLLISTTAVVLTCSSHLWVFLVIFGIIWLLAASFMTLLLWLVVSVDSISLKLKDAWTLSCCQLQNDSFRVKLTCKVLKSIKPMGIPYASMGIFRRATRTDYFYSLGNDVITAILAFKETT